MSTGESISATSNETGSTATRRSNLLGGGGGFGGGSSGPLIGDGPGSIPIGDFAGEGPLNVGGRDGGDAIDLADPFGDPEFGIPEADLSGEPIADPSEADRLAEFDRLFASALDAFRSAEVFTRSQNNFRRQAVGQLEERGASRLVSGPRIAGQSRGESLESLRNPVINPERQNVRDVVNQFPEARRPTILGGIGFTDEGLEDFLDAEGDQAQRVALERGRRRQGTLLGGDEA